VIGYFCKLIGGATGAAEEEWKKDVTKRLSSIQDSLVQISSKLDIINKAVAELMTETQLMELELSKILQGQLFSDVITKYKFPEHLDVVKTAVITPLLEKDSLLRVFVKQIAIKANARSKSSKQIAAYYGTYKTYVNSIVLELKNGFLLYSLATLFFEMQADIKAGAERPDLRISSRVWAARQEATFREIIEAFNTELVWLVLALSWEQVGGINPCFVIEGTRDMVARAMRFTARTLGEGYGLKGIVLSMGDRFNGAISVNGASLPIKMKAEMHTTEETDWWVARHTTNIFDEFRLSETWNVYFYSMPEAKPGPYRMSDILPYQPNMLQVTQIDEITGKPAADAGSVAFGSFLEVERAGGGFALMSGGWNQANPQTKRGDEANTFRTKDINIDYCISSLSYVPLMDGTGQIATGVALQATVSSGGEVVWIPGSLWVQKSFGRFQSQKTIRAGEAGVFEIQGEFQQLPQAWIKPGYVWQGDWLYGGPEWSRWSHEWLIPSHDAMNGKMAVRKLWYTPSTAKYGCYLHLRVYVFNSTRKDIQGDIPFPQRMGLANWDLEVDTNKNIKEDFSVTNAKSYFKGLLQFDGGTEYHLYVQPMIEVQVETSGLVRTPYFAYLGLQLTNLKISGRAT
jgi:hypothetical protein